VAELAIPIFYALFLWWFSTGLIAWADGLPRHGVRWSLGIATALGLAGLAAVGWSVGRASTLASYAGFTGALLVWGWNELAFLTGAVTGPRRTACPPGARGWRRTLYATQAVLYHELAIAACAVMLAGLSWNAVNPVGLWTFLLLWILRLSAKLNVFLGVPNLGEAFLPTRMAYLASYFSRRPINALFPLSITGATAGCLMLGLAALDPTLSAPAATGLLLLAALAGLALLEHWLMVLPLPAEGLWAAWLGARLTRADPSLPPDRGSAFAPSAPLK